MIEHYVEAVSSYAKDIDNLILAIAVTVGFWFIVAEFVFFKFIFSFRKSKSPKAQYITGEEKSQKKWISIPHLLVIICDIFLIFGAIRVWMEVKQELPPAEETIAVVGQQWAWTFTHPGEDNKLGTADDIKTVNQLRIKVNRTYHFKLTAKDVIHSFSVPVFRLKQDAIPGREITGWFKAEKTGEFDIQCAEMCGIGHGMMAAKLIVESPEAHAHWLKTQSRKLHTLKGN